MDLVPLPALIAHRAVETPEAPFITDIGGAAKSYAQVHRQSLVWARLLADLNVVEGDTVCLMLPTSAASVEAWMGIGWLGAWEVPVNNAYIGEMLQYILNNAEAKVMIVEQRFVQQLANVADGLTHLQTVVVVGNDPTGIERFQVVMATDVLGDLQPLETDREILSSDVCSVMYTSGTTGPSKGVMVPWGQLSATSLGVFPEGSISGTDKFYWPFPTFHVSGKMGAQLAALFGCEVVWREQFKTDEFFSDIARHECTVTMLLGAMANFLVNSPPSPSDHVASLDKLVMIPLIDNLEAFRQRFGVKVCTVFNMTETSSPLNSGGWIEGESVSCGRPRAGYTVRLVDADDQDVPDGTLGELVIRSDQPWSQMIGYYNMPEATVKATRNQWLHTGDGFIRDADGNFFFVDRQKDAIRRRGENISS
ncbi:MAG: AMP-binding protein, partial [Leucobacter sp.]|nr:AMP-binding protein [Leucobacter sp.]